MGQGFYLSRPVPADQLAEAISSRGMVNESDARTSGVHDAE